MGRRIGGRKLEDILTKLRADLEEHLGSINELKQGLRQNIIPKPASFRLYELVKSTGLPLVSGGLFDQPHIWLIQWEVIESVVSMYKALDNQVDQEPQPKNLMSPMRFVK